ncbi:MAG: DUF1566 domain-containing protein, partial [Myxococcales bacterium]|nr:DUF1566 domain-containing protein [Myxococcales bacterium]
VSRRDGNFRPQIYVMNANGSDQRNLSNNPSSDSEPFWSPDGTRIVFSSQRSDGGSANPDIYVMNADGSNPQRLTINSALDLHPSWSPEGAKITFRSRRDGSTDFSDEIYLMNPDGSDQQRLTNNSSIDRQPAWIRTLFLPDTGQTTCYVPGFGDVKGCAGTGQDGEYSINPMSFTDNGDGTVTDNLTTLMWQQDGASSSLNWYEASGTMDATDNPTSTDVCGSLALGGHNDWRLPTPIELMGIVDYGTDGPAIDTTYFPNTASFSTAQYWTSTTLNISPSNAWVVFSDEGDVRWARKGADFSSQHVRCVRGVSFVARYTDKGNGTVTDRVTGLIWQQEDDNTGKTWQQALDYCNGLALAGHSNWRLPNAKELESITDYTKNTPAIDSNYFLNTAEDHASYWSSTTYKFTPSSAWVVYFRWGLLQADGQTGNHQKARCVY